MLHDRMGLNRFVVSALCAFALLALRMAQADDWQPVTAEELSMTKEPKAPGAPAIYLYRQVDRDDSNFVELVYARIKILSDEGRKYADVEIPYDKGSQSIRSIEARVIRPDGSIAEFNGEVFEKPIVQGRGAKLLAKTFTLPDAQIGSIIEYRYRRGLRNGYVYDSRWILSQELFTRHAKFSLLPNEWFNLTYIWPMGLPTGTELPKKVSSRIKLETRDVPAFVIEDQMPPPDQLKYRVDFLYSDNSLALEKDPEVFWKKLGKIRYKSVDSFVGKPRVMEEAVAQIVAPGDSPETKLRKIYARTQQIRNLSFEREKTEQELKREAQKDAKNVADVWNGGYGNGIEVTWLFLGLARAAGFEADPVLVSTRDVHFFNKNAMNPSQLNSNVVLVKLDGKEMFFDPGTAFVPFGMLPWSETAVVGLKLSKDGGTWITTPLPHPSHALIERTANLRLTTSGNLEGTVKVVYSGIEALWRRQQERDDDDADRREFLENEIKWDIPSGINVALTNAPDWKGPETPLVAEYDIKVPGWAAGAGQRTLLTVGLFSEGEKEQFKHASREHHVYFNFPHKSVDDITIELPTGLGVTSLPQVVNTNLKVAEFVSKAESKNGALHLRRELTINMLILDKKYYSQLRDFFQQVRAADDEQIVVAPTKAPAKTPALR